MTFEDIVLVMIRIKLALFFFDRKFFAAKQCVRRSVIDEYQLVENLSSRQWEELNVSFRKWNPFCQRNKILHQASSTLRQAYMTSATE